LREFFTSESVTEGHPDKLCDQISDAVLDDILDKDPNARVACECCTTTGLVFVMGEITTNCYVDIPAIVRKTIKEIGYNKESGFDPDTIGVITSIHEQSLDIAMGVDRSYELKAGIEENTAGSIGVIGDINYDLLGAGDQGMMFGYASSETPELMPLAIMLAHKLAKRLTFVRKSGLLPYLRPDGKTQVTVEYENGEIKRVDTVVVSSQHNEKVTNDTLKKDIKKHVIEEIIPAKYLDADTKIYINPTGRFEIGGPQGDSGLTGRKIIVDTYGGKCAHGGGAFSGKDPTKVDRSGAYMARYICKNIVAAGLAKECTIEVAYAIGVAKPVSVLIDTKGTGKMDDEQIAKIVAKEFDLRPFAIIEKLKLRRPIYEKTAAYGHFGNSEFSWEQTDKVKDLKKYL